MGCVDDLAADMARSRIVRASRKKWEQKQSYRVRPKVPGDQSRLPVLTPAMAEEARRMANKARFVADWERHCAEEAAAYAARRNIK